MRGVLTPLVAVEKQLRSDFLFSLQSKTNGVQHKIHRLVCAGFICNNTVIEQIPDHRETEDTLTCVDIGNIRNLLTGWFVCLKRPVEQILIFVKLLPHLSPLPASANF